MKKNILLFLFLGFTAQFLSAQEMAFTVSPVIVDEVRSTDFEGVGYSTIINMGDSERSFTWTSNAVEITPEWAFAICDKNLCYEPIITTETFTLEADSAGRMDVHAYPQGVNGSAVVELTVVDSDNDQLTVSNLYYFNTGPSSTTEASRQRIKVYPNPSNGLFSIKGAKQIASVEILSLTGRQVKSFRYNDGQWYDISNLPKGTYLVRLIDRDAQQVVTKLINKL
jgi:hypothetical protein